MTEIIPICGKPAANNKRQKGNTMSYKLQKPYTNKQRVDFVVEHNHNQGLILEETAVALYALEADEIMQDGEVVKNPNYLAQELEKAKEAMKSKITKEKETAFKAGVVFNGAHFDCDDRAQTRLLFQFSQSKEGESITWLDYDYKPVEFDYESFMALCNEVTALVSGIEFKTGEYLAAIEAAQTLKELEEIEISY